MVTDDMFDSFPPTLLYNHVIRAGLPPSPPECVSFDADEEELQEGVVYLEVSGWPVRMVRRMAEESMEYKAGFRFWGDNHVGYRKTGSTSMDGSPATNDVNRKVVDPNFK